MSHFKSLIIFFFLFFVFGYHLNAQTDSLKHSTVQYFNQDNLFSKDSFCSLDNSLFNFQNYYNRNAIGGIGLPVSPLFLPNSSNELGFNYSTNPYKEYFYTQDKQKYFKARSPYSDLLYVVGSKREQLFRMTFSYNPIERLNITFNFSRLRADGFFQRQKTIQNNIGISSNFISKTNRYGFTISGIYNDINSFENGGITDDSSFIESKLVIDRALVEINLTDANKTIKNTSILFKQFLNFGSSEKIGDSIKQVIPNSRISLATAYNDQYIGFKDNLPNSGFYNSIYYDSIKTYDSTYFYSFSNKLEWSRVDNKKHRGLIDQIGFAFNLKHEINAVKQRSIDTLITNMVAGIKLFNTYSDHHILYDISANYGFAGFNKENYIVNGVIKKNIKDELSYISIHASISSQTPDFIYNRYYSNNFKWDNNFLKTGRMNVGGELKIEKIKTLLGINYSLLSNSVYFDNYTIARQYIGTIGVLNATIKNRLSFYNWNLASDLSYQNTQDSTVIRLPRFILNGSLFYENEIFKKAMNIQIGLSCNYNSLFYSNAYMPATGQFYLQDERKYGNYPLLDLFINAQVKTVRVFIKVENINDGLMQEKYVPTPYYPVAGRSYKLGVSWRFYD